MKCLHGADSVQNPRVRFVCRVYIKQVVPRREMHMGREFNALKAAQAEVF